ncbi:MAG: hypothetical protein ACFE8E_13955 [Candidatus Hodarchaeota archaeon]
MHIQNKKFQFVLVITVLILGATLILPSFVVAKKGNAGKGISAGAAKISIIGENWPYLIHDPLYARCVIINWEDTYVALVNLELLGISLTDVVYPIREGVEAEYGINSDYVLIGSTHSHSAGVDVIGWTGVLTDYVKDYYKYFLIDQVIDVIGLALSDMRRASVQVGSIWVNGMTFNRRSYPEAIGPTDDELTSLRFFDKNGDTIATLINWGVHPVLTMTGVSVFGVSADICGYACGKLEDEYGGVGVYFTAAMGDINPAPDFMWENKYSSPYAPDDPTQYVAAEEYGHALADYAIQALGDGKTFKNLPMKVAKVIVDYPLENPLFVYLVMVGVIQREIIQVGENEFIVRSELSGIKMGPIEMLTVPGELFSAISLFLKEKMPKYGFLLGLTTEELGYIIPSDEWGQDPGEVGESLSLGPQTAPIMIENLLQIIEELED